MRSKNMLCFVLRKGLREPIRPLPPVPPRQEAVSAGELQPLPMSVVIPAFNRATMLRRALASVAAQHPRLPAEVIVVDDGSDDDTPEVARQAGVRLIRHGRNRGLSAARNTGVEAASHGWIALLDSDDEWLPHHLATIWPHRTGHVLIASSALRCGSNSSPDRFHGPVAHQVEIHNSPNALVFPGNFVCVSTTMMLRSAVREAGGFRSHDGLVEDLDLWIRLLERGTGVFVPLVTITYHLHEQQMSMQDEHAMQNAHVAAAMSYADREWFVPHDVERWKATASWANIQIALRQRRYRQAAKEIQSVIYNGHQLAGLLGVWLWRFLIRRRGTEVDRAGRPSISVLPNAWSEEALRTISSGRRLRVRQYGSAARAVLSLIRRPTGVAFVGSRTQASLARLLRVRACRSAEEASELFLSYSNEGPVESRAGDSKPSPRIPDGYQPIVGAG